MHRLRFSLVAVAAVALIGAACSGNESGSPATPTSSPATSATATASSTPSTIASATPTTVDPGPAEHDGTRTYAHVEHLAGVIGPRVPTTPGGDEAVEYLATQFTSWGYEVERHEFSFESPNLRPATIALGAASNIDAFALAGSAQGPATAQAIFVGGATPAELADLDIEGKIAIALRDDVTFRDKTDAVVEAGAIALVIVNHGEGAFVGQLGGPAMIPVVGIGDEEGATLRAAAEAGGSLTTTLDDPGETTGTNVIARAGETCDILVGGHFDTVLGSPGASDNASGTAHVLELARAFAADGLDDGLCFATFDAEELGLLGSSALVSEWAANDELPRYVVNLDVTGTGELVQLIGDTDLVEEADSLAEALDIDAESASLRPGTGSDHQSFQSAGVTVLFFSTGIFEAIHTPGDTLDAINVDDLERVGDLAYEAIAMLLADIAAAGDQT